MKKFRLNSELLNRGIFAGIYQTYLGDLDINEECLNEYDKIMIDEYIGIMQYSLNDLGIECELKEIEIDKPTYYNYNDNAIVFDILVSENTLNELDGLKDNSDFIDFIHSEYINRSGYISFMPSSRHEYINTDIEKQLIAFLNYKLKSITDIIQANYEENVSEEAYNNGLVMDECEY